MLTAVFLHGHLGEKYGRRLMLDVDSVAGAIALLKANFASFARDVIGQGNWYRIRVGKSTVSQRELGNPAHGQDIHIVPAIAGAGGDVFNIILGIVLVVVGVLFDPTGYLAVQGVQMIFSGVVQHLLFSSIPKVSMAASPTEKKASRYFNGPINTTAQGNPVPVLYGRLLIGSQVISGGYSDKDA